MKRSILTIRIEGAGAAFFDENENLLDSEYVRILRRIADDLQTNGITMAEGNIYDYNGNKCGKIELHPE